MKFTGNFTENEFGSAVIDIPCILNNVGVGDIKDALYENYKTCDAVEGITRDNILDFTKPMYIILNHRGTYGIVCDCAWDDEHGVSIILSGPEIKVESDINRLV